MPDLREVAGQGLDRRPLGRGEGFRLFLGEPLVVRFQPARPGERFLPVSLQLPDDEPVLRFGELVLAARPAGGVAGALEPLAPQLVEHGPLVLGLGGGGHGDLQRGRRHRVQDLAGDPVIERSAGDVLAPAASPVVDLVESARVAVRGPCGTRAVVILDRHAVAAAATAAQQPGQQRRAVPGRAGRGGGLPVGGHPGDVRLVLLRRDVGRHPARQQHQPLAGFLHHAAGAGPARHLAARLDLAAAVGVIAGVNGVVQHDLQRLPGRAPPLDLPFRRSGMGPDRQLNLLADEVAEHSVEGPEPPEGAEDQADHMLRLLVRVEDDLAGRAAHVPDRQRDRQLAALGLGQLARQHPLPDQVQFCLAHRPF